MKYFPKGVRAKRISKAIFEGNAEDFFKKVLENNLKKNAEGILK